MNRYHKLILAFLSSLASTSAQSAGSYFVDTKFLRIPVADAKGVFQKLMQQAGAKCAPIDKIALFTGNASNTLAQFKFMCGVDEYQLTHWKIGRELIIDKHSGSIEPPRRMREGKWDFARLDKLEAVIDDLRTARSIEVDRQTFGSEWPYPKFNRAIIRCVQREFGNTLRPLVTIQLAEEIYGLNGVASGVGGYRDSRALMARDDESGTYRLGATGKLIGIGLDQCRQ